MAHHLPPPPRPGQSRLFHPPHDLEVRVLRDGTWVEGRLLGLHTDAVGVVRAEVSHAGVDGSPCRRTVPGHEVREPAAPTVVATVTALVPPTDDEQPTAAVDPTPDAAIA